MKQLTLLVVLCIACGCQSFKEMPPEQRLETYELALDISVLVVNQLIADGKLSEEAAATVGKLVVATEGALASLRATIEGGGTVDYAAALRAVREALAALNDYVAAHRREEPSMAVRPRRYLR